MILMLACCEHECHLLCPTNDTAHANDPLPALIPCPAPLFGKARHGEKRGEHGSSVGLLEAKASGRLLTCLAWPAATRGGDTRTDWNNIWSVNSNGYLL